MNAYQTKQYSSGVTRHGHSLSSKNLGHGKIVAILLHIKVGYGFSSMLIC